MRRDFRIRRLARPSWFIAGLALGQYVSYAAALASLSGTWTYLGFDFGSASPIIVGVGGLVVGLLSQALPRTVLRPSDVALWLLFSLVLSPTVVNWVWNPYFEFETRSLGLLATVMTFLVIRFTRKSQLPSLTEPVPPPSQRFTINLTFLALVLVTLTLAIVGVRELDLDFSNIYERRLATRARLAQAGLFSFAYAWIGLVLVPAFAAAAVAWRRLSFGLLGAALALLNFSIGGERIVLVGFLFATVVAIEVLRAERGSTFPLFGATLSALIALPVVMNQFGSFDDIVFDLTRRLGLVPAAHIGHYIEFYGALGHTYFAHEVPAFIWPSAAKADPGLLVGESLRPGTEMNANAGLIANAYASLGLLGVMVVAAFCAVLLRFLDRIASVRNRAFAVGLLGSASMALINRSFFTALLSGGIATAVGIVAASPGPDRSLKGMRQTRNRVEEVMRLPKIRDEG